ncbi:MAG: hypothetical protein ACI4QI_00415 [Candidatus Coproplasma sp.]
MKKEKSIMPHKNTKSKLLNILLTAECLAFVFLLGLSVYFYVPGYLTDYEIKDQETFFYALNNSAEIGVNREYRLTKDITVNAEDVKTNFQANGNNFYGTFDGQGKTITIVSATKTEMSSPLFGTIKEGATVKGLNLVLSENVTIAGEDGASVSLLASTNRGTIERCCVSVNEMVIGNCSRASVIVKFNYGTISQVGVSVDKITSNVTDRLSWNSWFGAVAVVNQAKVENVVIDINFDSLVIFNEGYTNSVVGYAFSSIKDGAEVQNIYVANHTLNWEKACDTKGSAFIRCDDLLTPCKEILTVGGESVFTIMNGKLALA